jgi:hypothetical protein
MRPYLKKKKKNPSQVLVEWLKWQSTCLASMKFSSNPSTTQKNHEKGLVEWLKV